MTTIPEKGQLLKHLFALLQAHRPIFKQERTYQRVVALVLAELFVFARHTVSQLLMTLGMVEQDWSAMYRVFSHRRFDYGQASEILLQESLKHVRTDELYVVAGDATQTPRNSPRLEGVSWLRNLRTPPFRTGIHYAQRWFNGCWMMPAEQGYSRAMPLRWMPAFTAKAWCQVTQPCMEWQAALQFMTWLLAQLSACGRTQQMILLLGDGNYDTLPLWQQLPERIILLARSARNRALYYLPTAQMHRSRKYGERAPEPQDFWRERRGWKQVTLLLRGRQRHLQYRIEGPFLRKRAADTPLFLLIIRGQKYSRHGRVKHRDPRPYLVNAVQDDDGNWTLPLDPQTLIFWAWQRWEIEVCHRELKSNFGLGNKQCWNPDAAVLSVQWSAWVYALLLLSAYRGWGLCGGPQVPTRWWRGAGRWSLNTLWRAYRAELWGQHDFRLLWLVTTGNWYENEGRLLALRNAIFGSARS
jgi:hypothetical protein